MNGVFGTVDGNWKACATGSSCVSCPPSVAGKIGPSPDAIVGATSTGSGPDGGRSRRSRRRRRTSIS